MKAGTLGYPFHFVCNIQFQVLRFVSNLSRRTVLVLLECRQNIMCVCVCGMKAKNEYSKLYIRTKLLKKNKANVLSVLFKWDFILFFYLCRRIYTTYPFDFKQNGNIQNLSSIVNHHKVFFFKSLLSLTKLFHTCRRKSVSDLRVSPLVYEHTYIEISDSYGLESSVN